MIEGDLKIRSATVADVDTVWTVVQECAEWLAIAKGLDHWKKNYTREMIANNIDTKEVYLGLVNNRPITTVSLSCQPVSYYTDEDMSCFADKEASAAYISALASLPREQSRGIGSAMMRFVEQRAREMGLAYLRFDCRADYRDLVEFYIKRGFVTVGTHVDSTKVEYSLMEKALT